MLRSHAALWESTGNREMLVFHTLSAGNIGQPGAPGTVVDDSGATDTEALGDGDADSPVDAAAELAFAAACPSAATVALAAE